MKSIKLVLYPDAVLRKKAKAISRIDGKVQQLIKAMTEIMYTHNGIGLAAPQVGYLQRIILLDVGDGLLTLINPEIVKQEGTAQQEEGCLSLPGISVEVERKTDIWVKALTPDEEFIQLKVSGLKARVIQHEIDHLNGRLIIDYATTQERLKIKDQLEALEKRYPFDFIQ